MADDPDATPWFAAGVPRTTGGIDYLVGEPGNRGRGLGSRMIAAFVEVAFARHPAWTHLCADPQVANVASWKALARAGFHHLGDYDDKLGPCRLMLRARGTPCRRGTRRASLPSAPDAPPDPLRAPPWSPPSWPPSQVLSCAPTSWPRLPLPSC